MAPFTRPEGSARMNGTRVIESLIIALVTGLASVAGSYLWTVPALRVQLDHLSSNMAEMREADRLQANQIHAQQADIIRLQAQMAQLQVQAVDLMRATHDRLVLLERRVFNIPK
ncbi:MAG: hypothetical protein AB7P08_17240 [Burkholderiales bacterium]